MRKASRGTERGNRINLLSRWRAIWEIDCSSDESVLSPVTGSLCCMHADSKQAFFGSIYGTEMYLSIDDIWKESSLVAYIFQKVSNIAHTSWNKENAKLGDESNFSWEFFLKNVLKVPKSTDQVGSYKSKCNAQAVLAVAMLGKESKLCGCHW